MPRPPHPANDQGETLLELLIAIAIMGIAVVAIVSGIATSVLMSDVHRKESKAGFNVRDYAEAVENFVASPSSGYTPCAPASPALSSYSPSRVGFTVPPNYGATASAAMSWNGTTWVACSADNGFQKVTLTLSSNDGRAREFLNVILRKPCRSSDSLCA
jgi:type II secretory pathway pseudopilin PulG